MKKFDEIKQQWADRELPTPPKQGSQRIIERSAQIRKKQQITQVVLGISLLILLLFFFYISAYNHTQTFLGLGLMIGCLLIRVILEYLSELRKGNLPVDDTLKGFHKKLEVYYNRRKKLHYIITPVLLGSYIIGFLLLLPSFSENLSPGFYTYVLISSVVVFVCLAVLIVVQIRRELHILENIRIAGLGE